MKPDKDDWTDKDERPELKKVYAKKLRKWKQELKPITGNNSLGAPRNPEAVKANLISASYPYPNLLAHSLYDARSVIKSSFAENSIEPGIVSQLTLQMVVTDLETGV